MDKKFGTIIEVSHSGNQYQVVPPCRGQEFALKPLEPSKDIYDELGAMYNANMCFELDGYTERFYNETVNSEYWKEIDFKAL